MSWSRSAARRYDEALQRAYSALLDLANVSLTEESAEALRDLARMMIGFQVHLGAALAIAEQRGLVEPLGDDESGSDEEVRGE